MLKTREEIISWLNQYKIENHTINEDLTVDVVSFVDISEKLIESIPFQLNKIFGDFDCSHNNLTSLKGSPKYVEGYFNCNFNKLNSLEGCPKIGTNLFCNKNKLTELNVNPEKIKGNIYCAFNRFMDNTIKQLEPNEVKNYLISKKMFEKIQKKLEIKNPHENNTKKKI